MPWTLEYLCAYRQKFSGHVQVRRDLNHSLSGLLPRCALALLQRAIHKNIWSAGALKHSKTRRYNSIWLAAGTISKASISFRKHYSNLSEDGQEASLFSEHLNAFAFGLFTVTAQFVTTATLIWNLASGLFTPFQTHLKVASKITSRYQNPTATNHFLRRILGFQRHPNGKSKTHRRKWTWVANNGIAGSLGLIKIVVLPTTPRQLWIAPQNGWKAY